MLSAGAVAFAAGAATMVIEIAAARVLAPTLGVSLYSWTAIIGVVLAGLAIGGWFGGRLADRAGGRVVVIGGSLVGAYGGLLIPVSSDLATRLPIASGDVVLRTIWISAATLLIPGLGLGAVVPGAVRMGVARSSAVGSTVGTIYASGTAGSILGVFATGFILVDAFGSRGTIALASGLVLVSLLGSLGRVATAIAAAPYKALLLTSGLWASPCTAESAYFCIQVIDDAETVGGQRTRTLKLDRLIHGAVSIDDPTAIPRGYARVMADVTDAYVASERAPRFLFIGGGAYVVPRYVEARYPGAAIDVVEIDPAVTRAVERWIGLPRSDGVRSHALDARQFLLERRPRGAYDVVYGDAFNDLAIPHHLTTREFAAMVRDALTPDGMYVVNVIDLFHEGRLLRSFMRTLSQVFPSIDLVLDAGAYEEIRAQGARRVAGDPEPRRTHVIVAGARRLEPGRLAALPGATGVVMPVPEVEAYLASGGIVLTDDHAPVDSLTAPMFLARPI